MADGKKEEKKRIAKGERMIRDTYSLEFILVLVCTIHTGYGMDVTNT